MGVRGLQIPHRTSGTSDIGWHEVLDVNELRGARGYTQRRQVCLCQTVVFFRDCRFFSPTTVACHDRYDSIFQIQNFHNPTGTRIRSSWCLERAGFKPQHNQETAYSRRGASQVAQKMACYRHLHRGFRSQWNSNASWDVIQWIHFAQLSENED